jgi:septal ring-binding cell division protein DamX
MDITIKKIRDVALTNLIVLGLASCSSSPAPWTQADDSPWGSKYAETEGGAPPEPVVSDTSYSDPVLLADPEPVSEPEPIMMQEPEMAPAPEVIAVVVEDMTPEQEIMAMPSSNYAVQVYASKTADSIEKFKSDKGLENLMSVKTDRAGSIVYVLVDVHPDRASANAAASELEVKTGSKPWVRSVAGLQKIVAE